MWLALSGLFRAKWTKEIHREWKRNLLKNRTDLSMEQLDRTSELMDRAFPMPVSTATRISSPDCRCPTGMTVMCWRPPYAAAPA